MGLPHLLLVCSLLTFHFRSLRNWLGSMICMVLYVMCLCVVYHACSALLSKVFIDCRCRVD